MLHKNSKTKPFVLLLVISSLTKLADLLVSPKTTLPYILAASGAPPWLISLLVPIKESGSLIPQWMLKKHVAHLFNNRTLLWRIGSAVQGIAILLMVAFIVTLSDQSLAYSVLFLLMLGSFGRAICSLTMKDIQAESIEKGRRGKLVGLASAISGMLTLLSAMVFLVTQQTLTQNLSYGLLIFGSICFILAFFASMPLRICYEANESTDSTYNDFFLLLKSEKNLKHLIASRVLLLHSALIIPFIVANSSGQSSSTLPYFIALSAFASLISSYIWGMMADKGAVPTIRLAAGVCLVAALAFGLQLGAELKYLDLVLFFILTVGHAGIRTGRKTYLLDITERSNRTGYVAAANTVVGLCLLSLGALYALLYNVLAQQIILLMTVFLFVGLLHTFVLKREK